MVLTSLQLSKECGVTNRTIQRNTKKAIEQGLSSIVLGDDTYSITKVTHNNGGGNGGVSYGYQKIAKPSKAKPKRKVKTAKTLAPEALPAIEKLSKPTVDEKIALISFYNTSNYPLGLIVKALILRHRSDIKPNTLQTKLKRWAKSYKDNGRSGLEDKRGGKDFKADLELVEQAILGAGNLHNTTLYGFYCYLYAEKNGLPINIKRPTSNISESSFNRAVKHLISTRPIIKDYLHLGMDAFVYAEPSFGRDFDYANQQWEVDATKIDVMAKVPVNQDGVRDYLSRDTDGEYHLVRCQLIRIIDNCTKASIAGLYHSSNSYANARLLYKAIATIGKPEIIKGDNGADYVSEHLQGTLEDNGIEYIATGKARGDEKGTIERSFRSLQHSSFFEALPGFVGHDTEQRKKLENQSSTKLEKLSGVATNIKADFMWHWELENWVDNFLAHKEEDKRAQHLPATEQELQEFYRTLGKKITRKVSKEGVRHNNAYFVSFGMWEQVTIGDEIEIREHIDDSTKLFLFKDGKFIGEIQDKNVFRQSQTIEEIKASKKSYKQRVVKDVKSAAKQAQKGFKGYQNQVRDEFIDLEVGNQTAKKKIEQQKQKTGFDPMAAIIKLANG